MQYHPDRFQGLAPELLEAAQRRSNLLNDAYASVGDDEKRPAYDEQLANWKGPLSTHGEIVVDLNNSHFSFSGLLGHLNADPDAREAQAETLALQFSGFEKATYEFFCTQAASPAGIPPALKAAYLEQLKRRDFYLSLREGFLWDSMGQRNHSPDPRLEYRKQARGDLEEIKNQARKNVELQVLLLAAGEQALLAPPEGAGEQVDAGKVLAHYAAQLDEHFARQTALLEPLAAEREQILNARFKTSAEVEYFPGTTVYTDKVVLGMKGGEKILWVLMEFDGDNVLVVKPPEGVEDLEKCVTMPDTPREWMERGYTILTFVVVQGIEFNSQLARVAGLHIEKLKGTTSKDPAA